MIRKENLLVAKIASKTTIKPALQCIAFYGDTTVSTDSFRLMQVPVQDGTKLDEPILMLANTVKLEKHLIYTPMELVEGYRIAEQYPDIEKAISINTDEEYLEVKVNGKLFGELLTQMSKLNKFATVTIKMPITKGKGIQVESTCDFLPKEDTRKAFAVMMPINKQ